MKSKKLLAFGLIMAAAGCNVQTGSTGNTGATVGAANGYAPASDAIRALAAPNQNLNAVRVDPNDGCYWFLYNGPVESTGLPLRSTEGRPICTGAAVGA
ncbi:hypothetical protein [Pseudoruegeria sp. SHC-113]|uniref:hypothetical protein n=1 Tax=Pseudoruegeria sp. SHC-113 TaxID=2855439 RepID=UPI0021BB023A|nr:hypothetical protein [Pseudoruegeria sp. SHC-113]MCT8159959.1 hypothetical protein [Pseudoruegeria sp. SHC-113]